MGTTTLFNLNKQIVVVVAAMLIAARCQLIVNLYVRERTVRPMANHVRIIEKVRNKYNNEGLAPKWLTLRFALSISPLIVQA